MTLDPEKTTYCQNLINPERYPAHEIQIGEVKMGDRHPVRIQSMTNTSTLDVEASVKQAQRIFDAGADFVRFTASSTKEAKKLAEIRQNLLKSGYAQPIIADVHFNPAAAEIAARYVEKVRINPGNFLDKKKTQHLVYSDAEYATELVYLRSRFSSFLKVCREHHTALRIGTNHGSLSDRIMSRYGDTPDGMVEATMEFLRICKQENFINVAISMKSSNTRIMVQAYRILMHKMMLENMDFPVHLGVTEAGDGEDGRIKSAVGIGSLMLDGIGDTIRVSLTEAPEKEIPVAQKLVDVLNISNKEKLDYSLKRNLCNPFDYQRRHTKSVLDFGSKEVPRVIHDLRDQNALKPMDLEYIETEGKYIPTMTTPDYIIHNGPVRELQPFQKTIIPVENWTSDYQDEEHLYPLYASLKDYDEKNRTKNKVAFVETGMNEIKSLDDQKPLPDHLILLVSPVSGNKVGEMRIILDELNTRNALTPVVFCFHYDHQDEEAFQLQSAAELGILFIDGLGDGVMLNNKNTGIHKCNHTAFSILQVARTRTVKTEYISCPSCGRTQFDIEKMTAEIRQKTQHLVGLKIGIMGCIVNGPGEMADADYGYVGTANGKITLYKKKEIMKRNIPSAKAVDELIALIKKYGDWKEPV